MSVPITSDLDGYESFWSKWITRSVMLFAGAWLVIIIELGAIIWAVWRK